MYETFEHTADLGLRVRAASLDELFVEAAQAMFSAIVEDRAGVRPEKQIEVRLSGDDLAYLLFDWLNDLLYRWDTEHLLFGRFAAQLTRSGKNWALQASAWGEPLDRSRHALEHEVKAITYHGLRVERSEDGWMAEVIVDI